MAKRKPMRTPDGRKALSCREAAERIGVSPKQLRLWIAEGEGPPAFVKPGPTGRSFIRIPETALDRWIKWHVQGRKDLWD